VKSLVLTTDAGAVVALTSGAHRADLERVRQLAGAQEIRRATPDEARAATGYAVGGTPPFGYPTPVRTFCDRTLLRFDVVWAAAGTPDSVFALAPPDLVRWAGATPADLRESRGTDRR
jgi:prolyl-tRNA editing enzyme YbaK/EbsC (Cys-tRNA(Pro) deacylase)